MSKTITYLLAGLAAVSAALPVQVAAQSVKLNAPLTHKLKAGKDYSNVKTATKSIYDVAKSLKVQKKSPSDGYSTPYIEEFNDESSLNDYTIDDANGDGSTWSYYQDPTDGGTVRYKWNSSNNADDWLITPGIKLKAGRTYNVSFKARANSENYAERIEAKWGQGTTASDLTEELIPSTELNSKSWVVLSHEITPAADGAYKFGLHAISDKDMYYLYVDSISVIERISQDAPDSVTSLKATADPSAALKITLSFNAPTKTIDGNDLSSLQYVIINKNNATIGTLQPVSPGEALSFVDENATEGLNTYDIIAANESGDGRPAKVSAIAGPDIPTAPVVTAKDNFTSIHFSWPDVKGANGGVIVPSQIIYNIWTTTENADGSLSIDNPVASVTGANEYDLTENTTEGSQNIKFWAFNARNDNGGSKSSLASVIEGAPYTIPYSNSFAGASLENQFFGVSGTKSTPSWTLTGDESADNDGGSAEFYNSVSGSSYYSGQAGEAILYTGKINLQGSQSPKLIFSYNGSTSTNARLVAEVEHYNGTIDSLWTESFTSGAGTWKTATINLPASVADDPYIFIHFHGIANDNNEQQIFVDNIHITAPYQNDAAIRLSAPASLQKGQDANIVATLSNQGTDDLSGLEVRISVNDQVVADTTVAKSLALFDEVAIPLTYKTSSLQNVSSLDVKAEVINANDLDDTNNEATANIELTQADVNAPTDLQGTESSDSVRLSWTAPAVSSTSITEDFESYNGWATSGVGDWTFVNADGGLFGSIVDNATLPNTDNSAAYEVWRPSDYFQTGSSLDPHSGSQCLASIYKLDNTKDNFLSSDDWLISPELSGKAQTISFWVNNLKGNGNYGTETFQVLTSSTDKQTISFTALGDDYTQSNFTWNQISVALPEGSKYFAIRRNTNSDDALLFLIDDITYKIGSAATSYNIYVDGNFVGTASDTSYNIKSDGADHTYSVTAVYSDGSESEPATIDLVANSIDDIHAQLKADKYDVYTIGGAQVKLGAKSLNGLAPGVYVINGKKVILK